MQQVGKYVFIAGIILLVIGAVFMVSGNKLNFLGKLPGDIRIEKENFKFYFPFTTMLLISGVINIIIWIIRKIF